MIRSAKKVSCLPTISGRRSTSSQRASFVISSTATPHLRGVLSLKRPGKSLDPTSRPRKKQVRWCRQMTQDIELDEEDIERMRFEKLNMSLQNYIREMQRAKNQLLAFQEEVMMKPVCMQLVEGLVPRTALNRKRMALSNLVGAREDLGIIGRVRKKQTAGSFVLASESPTGTIKGVPSRVHISYPQGDAKVCRRPQQGKGRRSGLRLGTGVSTAGKC